MKDTCRSQRACSGSVLILVSFRSKPGSRRSLQLEIVLKKRFGLVEFALAISSRRGCSELPFSCFEVAAGSKCSQAGGHNWLKGTRRYTSQLSVVLLGLNLVIFPYCFLPMSIVGVEPVVQASGKK